MLTIDETKVPCRGQVGNHETGQRFTPEFSGFFGRYAAALEIGDGDCRRCNSSRRRRLKQSYSRRLHAPRAPCR
jgi:hypothetical protein